MSLDEILQSRKLFIYRLAPTGTATEKDLPAGYTEGFSATYANIGVNEIVLTGELYTAAVLLHELAHVAGAPGRDVDATSHAAEQALKLCGLGRFYDDDATG